jgi:hypothetical protein
MVKKIVAGILFTVFAGALVTGAVIRTQDRADTQNQVERNALGAASASGQGQRGQGNAGNDAELAGSGSGQGAQGSAGQGKGSQGAIGAGSVSGGGAQKGASQLQGEPGEAMEWQILTGMAASVSEYELVIELDQGESLIFDGRTRSFALEQGFYVEQGDALTIEGFYEDGEFKIGYIEDITNGQSITIRGETGRPNWAGQGRGGQ